MNRSIARITPLLCLAIAVVAMSGCIPERNPDSTTDSPDGFPIPEVVPDTKIDEYRQRVVEKANADLESPGNMVFPMVKRAHPLVTVKSGSVTQCTVQTIDGSDSLGTDGSNIGSVTMQITVFWDANLQKNGRTVLEMVYSPRSNQHFSSRIVETDGMATVDDPAWWAEQGKKFITMILPFL